MSLLSCVFWFCCGCANDDQQPVERCQPPPPPPLSQTQMVAVVQVPPVQQPQASSHHHHIHMPPYLAAPPQPPPAPAMGYAMPPAHDHQAATPPWPHAVPPTKRYNSPWQPAAAVHAPSSPPPAPASVPSTMANTQPPTVSSVPPRCVSLNSHDRFLPSAETATTPPVPVPSISTAASNKPYHQAPPAAIGQQVVPHNKAESKRYQTPAPAPALLPTQTTLPRATSSAVRRDPSSQRPTTETMIPPRAPSLTKVHDDPPPAPVVVQTAWPARQQSKTY